MTSFPFTRLFQGPIQSILISGSHLVVFDNQTGAVVQSTAALEGAEKDAVVRSGPIRYCAVDEKFEHVATSGDDKKLKVWLTEGLKLLSERELPKKPTEIKFTRDGQTILVSDKFGDVWSYPLDPENSVEKPSLYVGSSKRGALTSHENPSNGALVLGHASLLTSFTLTPDEKYIITADRDEHIRVSWYPKGYVIERYCLGHEKYVSAIHIPSFAPSSLVSGGGDPMLKIWDWMSGDILTEIPIQDTIEPYIKVKAPKGKRDREEDGENEDGAEAQRNIGRKKKSRRGKGKAQEQAQAGEEGGAGEGGQEASAPPEDTIMMASEEPASEVQSRNDTPVDSEDAGTGPTAGGERTVLVVQRIESVDLTTSGHGRQLIFSAVGATALCYSPFPEGSAQPKVRALDLGRPIIDFTLDVDNRVWVFLDPNWSADETSSESSHGAIRLLAWMNGELVEATETPSLLSALRSNLLPATAEDLKLLDVYSPLASMPKNVDPEYDSMKRDNLSDVLASEPGADKSLTLREQARLKKKRALALKVQGVSAEAGNEPQDAEREAEVAGDERSGKKAKSEADTDVAHSNASANVSRDNMDES